MLTFAEMRGHGFEPDVAGKNISIDHSSNVASRRSSSQAAKKWRDVVFGDE